MTYIVFVGSEFELSGISNNFLRVICCRKQVINDGFHASPINVLSAIAEKFALQFRL
jgi:hypothetical protein